MKKYRIEWNRGEGRCEIHDETGEWIGDALDISSAIKNTMEFIQARSDGGRDIEGIEIELPSMVRGGT